MGRRLVALQGTDVAYGTSNTVGRCRGYSRGLKPSEKTAVLCL
jgi:hypothetical protein